MKKKILLEIFSYCKICPIHNKCLEEECVLFRIEKIVIKKGKVKKWKLKLIEK